MKATRMVIAAILAGSFLAQGAEFPLAYKKLSSSEAMSMAGGYGLYGSIQKSLRSQVKKESKAASAFAVYGILNSDNGKPMAFRLDESKGDRKGYDQLIVDLNQNGDLTDDPVINKVSDDRSNVSNDSSEQAMFGPVNAPPSGKLGDWQPVFYASMSLYNKAQLYAKDSPAELYLGSMRLYSGWLLEAKVEVDGVKETVALKDGNCNFQLSDPALVSKMIRSSGEKEQFYLGVRDYVLRDRNNSGQYTRTPMGNEAEGFSSLIYFGTKPQSLTVSGDYKNLRLEPYAGTLAEVQVTEHVSDVMLARELEPNKWEPLKPLVKDCKVLIPPGNYRLVSCVMSGQEKDGAGTTGLADGFRDEVIKVQAGQAQTLPCGLPMQLSVTWDKRTGSGSDSGVMGVARSLFGGGKSSQALTLQMNIKMKGAGGESYSRFYKVQGKSWNLVSAPKFRILDTGGALLASGAFEFG